MSFLPCLECLAASDLSISYLLYTGLDRPRLLRLTLQARAAQGLRHCFRLHRHSPSALCPAFRIDAAAYGSAQNCEI